MKKAFVILVLLLWRNAMDSQCGATFSYNILPTGVVNFSSTSTGTSSNTWYVWTFYGANTPSVSGNNLEHTAITYTGVGSHVVDLFFIDATTSCSASVSQTLSVNAGTAICFLHSNFAYTMNPNGYLQVASASTGSTAATSFSWNFGDGAVASGQQAAHQYANPGIYNVLIAGGNYTSTPVCQDTLSRNILVSFTPCPMSVSVTPTFSTYCNGSSTVVSTPGACSPLSYTLLPPATASSPTISNLCLGNYTFTGVSNTPGVGCCNVFRAPFTVTAGCNYTTAISYTPGVNGSYFFGGSTIPASGATYTWTFGNGNAGIGSSAFNTYSANGTYLVKVKSNVGGCFDSTSVSVVVTNVCSLISSFSAQQLSGGGIAFTGTTTGAGSPAYYTWTFGDSVTVGPCLCPSVVHTYTSNGTYYPTLMVQTSTPACISYAFDTLNVTSVCPVMAGFTYSALPNWEVAFSASPASNLSTVSYSWDFGSSTATGSTVTHIFPANGVYYPVLTVSNVLSPSVTCVDTAKASVNVSSSCALFAQIAHTVGAAGTVTFQSINSNGNAVTGYRWKFGDGFTGNGSTVVHAYSNGGAHIVNLTVQDSLHSFCSDSLDQSVNITGVSCSAVSGFTLVPTTTPQYWNAIPAYPWNVTAASWDWGDGQSSNALYASHTYSAAGNYQICLSVSVSCNATSSTCTSYQVYRGSSSSQLVHVNVLPPPMVPDGVLDQAAAGDVIIFPNPVGDNLTIRTDGRRLGDVRIYSLIGRLVIQQDADGSEVHLDTSTLSGGVYFVTAGAFRSKLVIER